MLWVNGNIFVGTIKFHLHGKILKCFTEIHIFLHIMSIICKLDNWKQGSRTVKEYYHIFKICIMFGGLDECMEDVMSRFMKGLNSEIRTC